MDLSSIVDFEPVTTKVLRWFSLFWPLMALAFLRNRGRSFTPLAAMLVPLTVAALAMWLALIYVVRGVLAGGGGRHALAAGFADAYELPFWGGCSALAVLAFALKKRHDPAADPASLVLTLLLAANVVFALVVRPTNAVLAGALFAGVLVIAALVRLFLAAREREHRAPVPYGFTAFLIATIVLGFIVQARIGELRRVAMGG